MSYTLKMRLYRSNPNSSTPAYCSQINIFQDSPLRFQVKKKEQSQARRKKEYMVQNNPHHKLAMTSLSRTTSDVLRQSCGISNPTASHLPHSSCTQQSRSSSQGTAEVFPHGANGDKLSLFCSSERGLLWGNGRGSNRIKELLVYPITNPSTTESR